MLKKGVYIAFFFPQSSSRTAIESEGSTQLQTGNRIYIEFLLCFLASQDHIAMFVVFGGLCQLAVCCPPGGPHIGALPIAGSMWSARLPHQEPSLGYRPRFPSKKDGCLGGNYPPSAWGTLFPPPRIVPVHCYLPVIPGVSIALRPAMRALSGRALLWW